jgi:alpha-mannosidase
MKRKLLKSVTILFLLTINIRMLDAQEKQQTRVEFKNAPVLFKEGNSSFQQILAKTNSGNTGKIVFSFNGRELLKADLKNEENKYLLTLPAVNGPKKIIISVKVNDQVPVKYQFTILPVKKWEIYLVQHSHTDIGYTRPQSDILAEQMRYIDYALDYCDKTDMMPDYAKFRWTCESAWVTREYLRTRPASQIERFKKRIGEGRIEVTGMFANMAEISDENIMYDFLKPLKEIKKSGIPVKLAMQNDVNGIAWCMPDYFKNTGVKYLVMGINETRSILPFNKPTCFWWESPAGEKLLAFRGDHYMTGNFFGIQSKAIETENLLWHLADLDSKNYPFDKIGIQFSGYFTDNSPPSTAACILVKEWNKKYEYPKLKLSLASEFPEYVEKNFGNSLPVYRAAWLDWWTDGYGSTSRETAEVRKVQNLEQVDEGLFAMISLMNGELSPAIEQKIDHISENAIFFDEHTCGADESIDHPYSENSTRQWLQKGAYAWEALKQVTLLNEEALARFQPFLKKADFPVIYVINPIGWQRSGHVKLFAYYEVLPVKTKVHIIDLSTGKDVPAQVTGERSEGAYWTLEVSDIPALGVKALKIEVLDQPDGIKTASGKNGEVLENVYYKITVDKKSGAINSLLDKELNLELIDSQNPYKLGQLIRETIPNRNTYKLSHTTVSNVKTEAGPDGQVWESIHVGVDLDGFEKGKSGEPKGVDVEIRLFKNVKKIELKYMARKEIVTDPEALYVSFPFSIPKSRIVFETIGGILSQGEQLQGSSSDWNSVQNFVAVRGLKGQVIVVSNEVPLWQFSDFNLGKFERNTKPGKTWLYSWVMNNYWFTNFRAFQEGGFSWSYQVTSTADTTNSAATKFAWGERNPILSRTYPAGNSTIEKNIFETLKIAGSSNIFLVNIRPSFTNSNSLILHFRELDGKPGTADLSSLLPDRRISKITEVNAIGEQTGPPITEISLKPFEVKFVEVQF